ncbi:MAG: hypothetical protein M3R68_10935 [Acidobacteriota bacterium]|nr:hypothetical protein [Acidobacteriota bacterium]
MKRTCGQVCVLILALCHMGPTLAQAGHPDQPPTVTFYSPLKYKRKGAPVSRNLAAKGDTSRTYFSFATGKFEAQWENSDLSYGKIYAGADRDWFVLTGTSDSRSVIRDLGERAWSDTMKVSAIQPLPKLKEGEQRRITIDTSGAPGSTGANGADGAPGVSGDNLEALASGFGRGQTINRGAVRVGEDSPDIPSALGPVPGWRPSRKKVVNPPVLVKATLGHMYVIHIVDSQTDSYILVHVDALLTGDKCTISWKRVSASK